MTIWFLAFSLITISCKKEEESDITPEPITNSIKGVVTELESDIGVGDVNIVVFNAENNTIVGEGLKTNSDGTFSVELDAGNYYLQISKQGFEKIPATGITPIIINVVTGEDTKVNFSLSPSKEIDAGLISGKVQSEDSPIGVLIIASSETHAYSSTITSTDGSYTILNVPEGNYIVQAFIRDYNSTSQNITVSTGTETNNTDITLSKGTSSTVTGTISFLATENGEVDVALIHPLTKEVIPGLNTRTTDASYEISGVPNGKYIARASFDNDTYVVDPDWIIKNGEPTVDATGQSIDLPFSVTGAVTIISPSVDSNTITPVEITEIPPTFVWNEYSSTSDYIIEVSDINGNVIWGGFTVDGTTITKNVSVPKGQLSVVFNYDGSASESLQVGRIYRWRVFASKDDSKDQNGWKLISVSEDQKGLFIIQ